MYEGCLFKLCKKNPQKTNILQHSILARYENTLNYSDMTCDVLIHVLGDIKTYVLKTFEYEFSTHSPKLSNQNPVFISCDVHT